MRCLLVGNYGVGNMGDEFLKEYFLKAFPGIQWQVVSAHPAEGEFPRLPSGIRSFLGFSWIKTLRALRNSDAIVFGGGSLFTDSESAWACWVWCIHAFAASMYRKPILLAFQGVGPFHTRIASFFAGWVIRHAAFVSVRDTASFHRVKSIDSNIKVIQTFDPVLALIRSQNENRSNNVFIVIPRAHSSDSFLIRAVELWKERGMPEARVVSLEPTNLQESAMCLKVRDALGKADICAVRSLDDVAYAFRDASFVLTQRYHGGLIALALGIPFETVSQKPGDKLGELMAESALGRSALLAKVETGASALREAFSACSIAA